MDASAFLLKFFMDASETLTGLDNPMDNVILIGLSIWSALVIKLAYRYI